MHKLFVVALTAVALVGGVVTSSQAESFSEKSLKGAYGLSAFGSIGGAPASAIGRIVFDGDGGCSETAILNVGGVATPLATVPGGCTYTVNPDGTGTIDADFGPGGAFSANFVIVDNKKEFRFIVSGPTVVAEGVAKRQ